VRRCEEYSSSEGDGVGCVESVMYTLNIEVNPTKKTYYASKKKCF